MFLHCFILMERITLPHSLMKRVMRYLLRGNAKISTTQSKFGGSSGYFDGSGDYLTFAFIGFLTGNFTAECWIYPTVNSGSYKTLFNFYNNGAGLYQINDTILWWEASGPRCTSAAITMNAWHHVAVTRTGMTVDVWVDGVKSATSYTSSLSYASGTMIIGCGSSGIEPYTGYIDDFRFTLGTRYTANFPPPFSSRLTTMSATPSFHSSRTRRRSPIMV